MTQPDAAHKGAAIDTFFREACAAFEAACDNNRPVHHDLALAGRPLRLSFAGSAMVANILPALQHLCCEPQSPPLLHVRIFDSASTGEALPPRPWGDDAQVARGEIVGLETGDSVRATFQPGSAVLTLYHPESASALIWMADARRCPSWEAAAPLRGLLHWWCERYAQQLVHAAAVGTSAGTRPGALLLTGKGGSGKSTTALAALAAGMQYIGDDYVVCDTGAGGASVHSLYNTAKVDAGALALLPGLATAVDLPPSEELDKSVMYLSRSFPEQVCRTLPLRAIVVPRVTKGPARLHRMESAAAFLALAPTTLFQLPGAGRETTGFLRRLVTDLPCLQLDLSPDPTDVARLLASALEGDD